MNYSLAPPDVMLDLDSEETFGDRRLSDLLPTEFITQIGLDPNQYLAERGGRFITRRATEPTFNQSFPPSAIQRRISTECYTTNIYCAGHNNTASYLCEPSPSIPVSAFEVELPDKIVKAFTVYEYNNKYSGGVIITDGEFLRYGQIIKLIPISDLGNSNHEILHIDLDSMFGDFIMAQSQIAKALSKTFVQKYHIQAEILDVETVSFKNRALMRIKVTDSNAQNISFLIRDLIGVFSSSIEIYE